MLIEKGRLVGLMQDRQNARLMGVKPTGNGRRQSHAYAPMPRMTNTIMLGGTADPQEIIGSVKKGLYCANFGGGQVDIVSGKFVFTITEGYLIEDGKLGAPVKGATLIGAGSEALTKVGMVGNDMALDPGIGTCGKDGQGVPVGVGQPTLRIDALTVGGTATRLRLSPGPWCSPRRSPVRTSSSPRPCHWFPTWRGGPSSCRAPSHASGARWAE